MFSISNKQKSVDWFIYLVLTFENIPISHFDMKISKFLNFIMKLKKFFGGFTELIQQKHQMCAQNEDMTKFKCIHIANNIIITRLGVYF